MSRDLRGDAHTSYNKKEVIENVYDLEDPPITPLVISSPPSTSSSILSDDARILLESFANKLTFQIDSIVTKTERRTQLKEKKKRERQAEEEGYAKKERDELIRNNERLKVELEHISAENESLKKRIVALNEANLLYFTGTSGFGNK